jgi:antitoxin ParD1/3/4
MNVSFPKPQELESYIEVQIQSGTYASVTDYFLALINQDRKNKDNMIDSDLLKKAVDNNDAFFSFKEVLEAHNQLHNAEMRSQDFTEA